MMTWVTKPSQVKKTPSVGALISGEGEPRRQVTRALGKKVRHIAISCTHPFFVSLCLFYIYYSNRIFDIKIHTTIDPQRCEIHTLPNCSDLEIVAGQLGTHCFLLLIRMHYVVHLMNSHDLTGVGHSHSKFSHPVILMTLFFNFGLK